MYLAHGEALYDRWTVHDAGVLRPNLCRIKSEEQRFFSDGIARRTWDKMSSLATRFLLHV